MIAQDDGLWVLYTDQASESKDWSAVESLRKRHKVAAGILKVVFVALLEAEMLMSVKFDETKRAKYLALLREGGRRGASAEQVGVSIRTVQRALEADKEFARDVSDAEGRAHEMVEDALFRRALDGNTTAQIFYLTNRSPNRWQDRRGMGKLELSGTGGGSVEIAALRERGRELVARIAERAAYDAEAVAPAAELPSATGPESRQLPV